MDVLFANGSWTPFFDVDTANQGAFLGREFAGRDAKGKRVFGLVSGSALATHVLADSSTLWEVPDKWTLEQASTISVAYVLVSYRYNIIRLFHDKFTVNLILWLTIERYFQYTRQITSKLRCLFSVNLISGVLRTVCTR